MAKKWFLVILAIMAAVYYFGFYSSSTGNNTKSIQTVKPVMGNIEETVTAQGKLESKEYVDVGAQVSGQLKKIYFEIGDIVKKGDLIAEIDPKIYESKVQADEAKLKTLKAQLVQQQAQAELANQQNERNTQLLKSDAISKEEMETSQSNLKVANAQVVSLRAQIEEQNSTLDGDKANLSYTKIYAPMDGTVVLEPSREGQTLNANQSAPVIVQLANLDVMTIRAQVAEADVMRLKPDMGVYFTTLGSLDKKWQAKIRQILPSPEVINDVVLYNALIDVDNTKRELMTGMSVQIFFLLGKAENVLTIPVSALGKKVEDKDANGGSAYSVNVKSGSKVIKKTVYIGLMNRISAEVQSGLSADDEIVMPSTGSGSDKKPQAGFMAGPRV